MNATDLLGWVAATLTLLTFFSGDMVRLRLLALAANGAFIYYGLRAGLYPVLALHLLLVPVNLWRLAQLRAHLRRRRLDGRTGAPSSTPLPTGSFTPAIDPATVGPCRPARPHLAGPASPLRHRRRTGHALRGARPTIAQRRRTSSKH